MSSRWFWSKACVTEPRAISVTFVTRAASGVVTVKVVPGVTTPGAALTMGRAPLKRYGGEKISAECLLRPPALSTRPSGSSSAVEW